jgi:pimeloyl-ACP methyl ester carboxylesterase
LIRVASAVDLHVESLGEGEPAFVLLHGFGGSARNFRSQVRELRDFRRVVVFDARGHARSAAPGDSAAYSPELFAEDMARVAREHGGASPVIAGGLSMGAAVALRFALTRPDRVCGLVLASFPGPGDDSETGWARSFARAIDEEGLERAGERYAWGGGRFDDTAAKFIRQGFLEHDPHALAATLRNVIASHPDVRALHDELAKIKIPVLVVAGERDTASVESSRVLKEALPFAEHHVVPGAGHVVNLEKPESFNALVREFSGRFEA